MQKRNLEKFEQRASDVIIQSNLETAIYSILRAEDHIELDSDKFDNYLNGVLYRTVDYVDHILSASTPDSIVIVLHDLEYYEPNAYRLQPDQVNEAIRLVAANQLSFYLMDLEDDEQESLTKKMIDKITHCYDEIRFRQSDYFTN